MRLDLAWWPPKAGEASREECAQRSIDADLDTDHDEHCQWSWQQIAWICVCRRLRPQFDGAALDGEHVGGDYEAVVVTEHTSVQHELRLDHAHALSWERSNSSIWRSIPSTRDSRSGVQRIRCIMARNRSGGLSGSTS